MESKEKEISKTTDKKNSERIKEKLMEKEFTKFLEEPLEEHPADWVLNLTDAWIKKTDNLPFGLSDQIKSKSKLSQNEKEKLRKTIANFFIKKRKFQEIQRKVEKEFLLLQKPWSPEPPILKIEQPTLFIIPSKLDKLLKPIFQILVTEKDLIKEEKVGKDILQIYQKDELTRQVCFNILRGHLETLKYTKSLSLGGLGWRAFIATLGFAFKQETLSPTFTKTDKLRCLGYTEEELKKGGKIYELIERTEKLLAYLTYDIVNKRKGKEYREKIGHLYDTLEIRGKGKGALFNPTLNEKTIGEDLPHLINEGINGISYKLYHPKLLQDRELSPGQRRLCAYLVGLRGFKTVEKTARYLLLDIIGISGKQFKTRLKQCHDILINKGLGVAKKKGYLENYKVNYKDDPLNVRKWSFTLYLPKERKHIEKRALSLPAGSNLIDQITEWNSREVFNTKKPKGEIKIQVANTVKTYRVETIERIFKSELNKNSPHPMNFWNEVKKLKRVRQRQKE